MKTTRERRIREGLEMIRKLVIRVEEIIWEIKSKVRIGEEFWLVRRIGQDRPLSPILFNILTIDRGDNKKKME